MDKKPHKHAELIKAWADGAEIEYEDCGWHNCTAQPLWDEGTKYRLKPEPPKYPQTRMTEKERWDAITAAGISNFNIGTGRAEGSGRLEHSPSDVTAAIANAAITRAIEDKQVYLPPGRGEVVLLRQADGKRFFAVDGEEHVPAAMLEKVANEVRATCDSLMIDIYKDPSLQRVDLAAIVASVKEGK